MRELRLDYVQAAASTIIRREDIKKQIGGIEHYVRTVLPHNMDALVVSLVSVFAAEPLQIVEIKYPRDWREAVKERWAPSWALRRWPVQYVVRKIDIKAIWQNYSPDPRVLKHGPFLPYVLDRQFGEAEDME